DVVAGTRTPQQITLAGSREWAVNNSISEEERAAKFPSLEEAMPAAFTELDGIREKLEKHYRDMQDIEFTIERDKLFMLQTRGGKRTAAAAVKIAVDLAKEGLLSEKEAVCRVDPRQLDQLLHPTFDGEAEGQAPTLGKGLPASPGAAKGKIVFSAEAAEASAAVGKDCILVRIETSPEDIGGMHAAKGILTARGGMTSHAAVVARGMGKCCVAGCGEAKIDYQAGTLAFGDVVLKAGDWISLNGSTGTIYQGAIKTTDPELTGPFGMIMDLADKYRTMGIRTNADTPNDTEVAVKFGAEGIGLCRTEHMFFEGTRIVSMRKMILAKTLGEREDALAELLPMQRGDFEGIFRALGGRPGTIRLLDPPLHEFLPHEHSGRHEVALQLGITSEEVAAKVNELHEFNPMLGFRGCRLAVVYPEILKMQVRAIMEAALNVQSEGIDVHPEIMIPLVGHVKELAFCKAFALEAIEEVFAERQARIDYSIGTMIEVPRAAITADEVATEAEFFSFGTNDLTQMTCGFSRDDSGRFLNAYVEDEDKRFFEFDPFQVLDQAGVGKLVKIAVDLGRSTRPDIKLGICGEHGGEPNSVAFCHGAGLDYVSCSPYRVPIARLAAAQAAIQSE
ncbi:MAG: pyruvate, phosphate dikinase, partial [Lentisphaeria bacterium]|nr:pyruvate, phosphate dikinase [Lentisphaeria bacterium]